MYCSGKKKRLPSVVKLMNDSVLIEDAKNNFKASENFRVQLNDALKYAPDTQRIARLLQASSVVYSRHPNVFDAVRVAMELEEEIKGRLKETQ